MHTPEFPREVDDPIMVFLRAIIGAYDAGQSDQAFGLMKAIVEFDSTTKPSAPVPVHWD